MLTRLAVLETPLGWLGLAERDSKLTYLVLPRPDPESVRDELARRHPAGELSPPEQLVATPQLERYFRGELQQFNLELDLAGVPPFFRRALDACARVPYGATTTYRALADELGNPKASRAVGGAMASNPIPIVIPCHRVVGSTGSLTGFGGGLDQKQRLLALEATHRDRPGK